MAGRPPGAAFFPSRAWILASRRPNSTGLCRSHRTPRGLLPVAGHRVGGQSDHRDAARPGARCICRVASQPSRTGSSCPSGSGQGIARAARRPAGHRRQSGLKPRAGAAESRPVLSLSSTKSSLDATPPTSAGPGRRHAQLGQQLFVTQRPRAPSGRLPELFVLGPVSPWRSAHDRIDRPSSRCRNSARNSKPFIPAWQVQEDRPGRPGGGGQPPPAVGGIVTRTPLARPLL
jgi:hypothetical protein